MFDQRLFQTGTMGLVVAECLVLVALFTSQDCLLSYVAPEEDLLVQLYFPRRYMCQVTTDARKFDSSLKNRLDYILSYSK